MFSLLFIAALTIAATMADDRFKDCGGSTLAFSELIVPDPIPLTSGGKLKVLLRGELKKDMPARFKLKVKMQKKILWGYVTLPCIGIIGSCTHDMDCAKMYQYGLRCSAPAGPVLVDEVIVLPSMPIPSFIANGPYKLDVEAISMKGETLGCAKASFKLTA